MAKANQNWKRQALDGIKRIAIKQGGEFLKRKLQDTITSSSSTKNQNSRPRDGAQIIDTSQNYVTQFVKNKKTKKSRKTKFEKKVAKALQTKAAKNIFFQYSTYGTWSTDWAANEGIQQIVRGDDLSYTVGGNNGTAFPNVNLVAASEGVGWVKTATAVAQKSAVGNRYYIVSLIQVDYTFKLKTLVGLTTATCVILDIYECIASQTQSTYLTPASTWNAVDSSLEQLGNNAGNSVSKGMTPWQSQSFGQFWTILKKTRIRMTPLEPHCYQLRGVPGIYSGTENTNYVVKGKTKGLLFVICPEQYQTGIANAVPIIDIGFNRTCHWKLPNGASVVNQNIKTMGEINQITLGNN